MSKEYFIKANKIQKERCNRDDLKYCEIHEDYHKDMMEAYDWISMNLKLKMSLKYNQ